MPVPPGDTSVSTTRVLLRDVVKDKLQTAIMDGTFHAGEPLVDAELQRWLGVSRTPVREAINELARMGLIEMEPNRYTRVAIPEEKDVVGALQTLGVLYVGAVRLGLPRSSAATRKKVSSMSRALEKALRDRDTAGIRKNMSPMFNLLAANSDNQQFERVYRDSVDGLIYHTRAERAVDLLDVDAMADAVQKFTAAVDAGDASAALLATEQGFEVLPRSPIA